VKAAGLYDGKEKKSNVFFDNSLILFPINIFKAFDLNYTQKSLLSLCFLYRNSENLIDIDTIIYKWNGKRNITVPRKLLNHLKTLEKKGYINLHYHFNKLNRLSLNNHPVFISQHVCLKKSHCYNNKVKFEETLLMLYYMSQTIKWCNYSTKTSEILGIHRTTVQKYSDSLVKKGIIKHRGKSYRSFTTLHERSFVSRNNFVHKPVKSHVPKTTLSKYNKIIFTDKFSQKRKQRKELVKKRVRLVKELIKIDNITFMNDNTLSLKQFLKKETHLEEIQKRVKQDKDTTYDTNYIQWLAKKLRFRQYAEKEFYSDKLYNALMNDRRSGEDTFRWDIDFAC